LKVEGLAIFKYYKEERYLSNRPQQDIFKEGIVMARGFGFGGGQSWWIIIIILLLCVCNNDEGSC